MFDIKKVGAFTLDLIFPNCVRSAERSSTGNMNTVKAVLKNFHTQAKNSAVAAVIYQAVVYVTEMKISFHDVMLLFTILTVPKAVLFI